MNKKLLLLALAVNGAQLMADVKKDERKPLLSDKERAATKADVNKNINLADVIEGRETNLKLATVNILEVMRDSKEGKQVGVELEERRKQLTDDIRADDQKFAQAMNNFKNKSATLSDTAREKEESRLMGMRRDLEAKVQKSEDELKHAMQKASDRLTVKVQKEVERVAQAKNVDLVIDEASGRVLHSSKRASFTKEVVASLNAEQAQTVAKAKAPQATKVAAAKPAVKPVPAA